MHAGWSSRNYCALCVRFSVGHSASVELSSDALHQWSIETRITLDQYSIMQCCHDAMSHALFVSRAHSKLSAFREIPGVECVEHWSRVWLTFIVAKHSPQWSHVAIWTPSIRTASLANIHLVSHVQWMYCSHKTLHQWLTCAYHHTDSHYTSESLDHSAYRPFAARHSRRVIYLQTY